MRREHKPDDRVGTPAQRPFGGLRDARRPVLHTGEDRQSERALERGPRLLRDCVQRVGLFDAESPVAGNEIFQMLRSNWSAASDVGVVRGNVVEPLG